MNTQTSGQKTKEWNKEERKKKEKKKKKKGRKKKMENYNNK